MTTTKKARTSVRIAGSRGLGALVLAVGIVLATSAWAADVDGTWTGQMATPNGDVPITFVFKADGNTLTGHMVGMNGEEIPIANGTIEGAMIAYQVTLDFGGMPFEMAYTGTVAPTEIKLILTIFDMPIDLTVKKAN